MRKTALIATGLMTTLLGGCASGGLYHKNSPDEFAVQRQRLLVVPPDFALVPPRQGEPLPSESSGIQQQTLDVLFGGQSQRSPVEQNVLSRAGSADAGIRSNVGDPDTFTVAKGQLTRAIVAAPEGDGQEAQVAVPAG